MTDLLKERIADAEWRYGNVSIEHVGKTGGIWFNEEVPTTWSFERDSLSTYIKKASRLQEYRKVLSVAR